MDVTELKPGYTVRFIVEEDELSGPKTKLVTGNIHGEPFTAWEEINVIPVVFTDWTGEQSVGYIRETQILSVSPHPSGGLP